MFCRNCGTKLIEGVKFYNNCGIAQEVSQPTTDKPEVVVEEVLQPTVCKNCGIELADGVKFCSNCGTAIESIQPIASTQQPVSQPVTTQNSDTNKAKKLVKSKGFIGGIVMIVFGFIAIYGSVNNGKFEKMSTYGADLADIIVILLEVGLILGGAYLVYKGTKKEQK